MASRVLIGTVFLAATAALCEEPDRPTLSGYVTRVASPADFDVNGKHVLLGPRTIFQRSENGPNGLQIVTAPGAEIKPYFGEPVDIYGELTNKTHTIAANRIVLQEHKSHPVSGLAIIDAMLPTPANATSPADRMVRADGYSILITGKTKIKFEKPLSSSSAIHVNVWITYQGTQRTDGIVIADAASFKKNTISETEDKLREKWEYDPAAVEPKDKQDPISKAVIGVNPKQIPPYTDDAMQARVSTIGAKLVPKYQVEFPYTEETRIDFRFQVVDGTKFRDALTLPDGIILVPHEVVERLQNDSQLATVLADNIACALEKQTLSMVPLYRIALGNDAVEIVGLAIPGVGLAADTTALALGGVAARQVRLREEQRARVSLSLLHDAGYDINQAPLAWWLLVPKNPKDIADIPLPRRAAYLYQFLGETWPPDHP